MFPAYRYFTNNVKMYKLKGTLALMQTEWSIFFHIWLYFSVFIYIYIRFFTYNIYTVYKYIFLSPYGIILIILCM